MSMEALIIEEKDGYPKVILDKGREIFLFSGKSLPENAKDFYSRIVDWLDDYSKDPLKKTKVTYKMDYFNTASSKRILDVLEKFEEIHEKGNEVQIEWYYLDIDEDMLHAGQEYANIVNVPMELISYE
jgi:organic radical activating enzyme